MDRSTKIIREHDIPHILQALSDGKSQVELAKEYSVTQPALHKIKRLYMEDYLKGKLNFDSENVDVSEYDNGVKKELRRQNEFFSEMSERVVNTERKINRVMQMEKELIVVEKEIDKLNRNIKTVNMLVSGFVEIDKRMEKLEKVVNSIIR